MRENAREQSGRTTRTLAALAACARWHWQAANGEAGDCALQSSNGETAAHAKETYPNGNRTGHPRVAGTDPAECHLDRMEGGNTLSSDQRQPIMVEIRIQPRHTDRHSQTHPPLRCTVCTAPRPTRILSGCAAAGTVGGFREDGACSALPRRANEHALTGQRSLRT